MKTISLCIPENAEDGDTLNFLVDGQTLEFNVSAGMEPGSMIKITLDENQSSSNHDEKNDVSKIDQEVKITLYDDVTLSLVEYTPKSDGIVDGDGTCCVCWKTGEIMAKFLSNDGRSFIEGRHVVELGAGLGACGMAAAIAGAKDVTLTDIDIRQLRMNVGNNRSLIQSVNKSVNLSVQSLVWGANTNVKGGFDVVLCADLLYDCNTGYDDLTHTLCNVCSEQGIIFIGVRWRKPDLERKFFEKMDLNGFEFEPIESPLILCKGLNWKSYGDPSNPKSTEYLSQQVSVGGKQISIFSVTEDHQNVMNDEEYDNFESLQIQIYLGHRRNNCTKKRKS